MMNDQMKTTKQNSSQFSVRDTVEAMQAQYAKTGSYKAEDLTRVLGDPRVGVGCTTQCNHSMSWCEPK